MENNNLTMTHLVGQIKVFYRSPLQYQYTYVLNALQNNNSTNVILFVSLLRTILKKYDPALYTIS